MPTPERGPVGLESRSEGAKKTLFGSARSHAEQFGQLVKENRNKEPKQKAVKSCVIVFCTAQPRHLRFDLPIVQSCSFVFFFKGARKKTRKPHVTPRALSTITSRLLAGNNWHHQLPSAYQGCQILFGFLEGIRGPSRSSVGWFVIKRGKKFFFLCVSLSTDVSFIPQLFARPRPVSSALQGRPPFPPIWRVKHDCSGGVKERRERERSAMASRKWPWLA